MVKIKVLNRDLRPLGSTSKAFNLEKTKELMREYTLSFSVVNNDSIFPLINEDSCFLCDGQYFDISGIDGDSGSENTTQVVAEHISYRMADYTLPNNYSFFGTVRQIAEDIMAEAKTVDGTPVGSVFSVGECADIGTVTFALSGKNVTAREALVAMSKLGVEVDFDNFVVNIPKRVGSDNGITFEYGRNLNNIHRTWQKGNGWSYDVKIVDLHYTGTEGQRITVGDTVRVDDGNSVIERRIISYTECDDPSQNRITVGVFVRDNASFTIETEKLAMAANDLAEDAKSTADKSVLLGEKYNNLKITHENGVEVITFDDKRRLLMNGQDGFAVQIKRGEVWVTVNSLEEWGLLTERLTTQEDKEHFYVGIGSLTDNENGVEYGIQLIRDNEDSGKVCGNKWAMTIKHSQCLNLISSIIDIRGSHSVQIISPEAVGISGEHISLSGDVRLYGSLDFRNTVRKIGDDELPSTSFDIGTKRCLFNNGLLQDVIDL